MSNANEAAYPQNWATGLTKRELFAAMAMQGIIGQAWHPAMGCSFHCEPNETAEVALQMADALLAELANPTK